MRLQTLEVEGWLPFGQAFRVELPNGPIAVVGTHSGDSRRSNRAGKTSLLEAITWCLYGEHRKRLDDAVIHRGSDEARVAVSFGQFVVTRSRRRGSSTKLVVRKGETELTGKIAQEAVESFVGMGLGDYLATSCFRQGDVEAIITRTAGERLALVSEWLQQDRWFDAKRVQAARATASDQRLAAKRAACTSVAADVMTEPLREAMRAEVERHRATVESLGEKIAQVHRELEAAAEQAQLVQMACELREVREQARECRGALEGKVKAIAEREERERLLRQARQDLNQAEAAVAELKRIRHSGFDGTCPVTCEQCPVADTVTQEVRRADGLLKERTKAVADAASRAREISLSLTELRANVNALELKTAQYQALVIRGKDLRERLGSEEEPDAAADPSELTAILADLQRQHSSASRRIGELEGLLESDKANAARHEQMCVELEEYESHSRVSRLALRAIAAIPARIAERQLGELEREANQLLSGTGISLRFSWLRELADKAPVCDECSYVYRDKRGDECPACGAPRGKKLAQELEILCDDGSGAEEDIRYNSGGTRAIAGSAIRLAASAMLRRLRSSQAAWAIVDEPFGPLDVENREMLARTFAGMLGSVGLEQALVVSHDSLLLSALPHRLVIDKHGSESTVRLE